MEVILKIKEFIVEQSGEDWTAKINGKTYEAQKGISINIIDSRADVHLFGVDNPVKFEMYESIRKLQLEREPDGSLYIELFVMGY